MVHPPRPAAIAPPQTEPPWTGGLFRPGETPPALAGGENTVKRPQRAAMPDARERKDLVIYLEY